VRTFFLLVLSPFGARLKARSTTTPSTAPRDFIPVADPQAYPPILFVHGNGDSAAIWLTTVWRFESCGYPSEKLFVVDFPDPLARDDDNEPQAFRSSATEQREYLAAQVEAVLERSGASKLVLIGNSRGGNSIRSYLKYGGGASKVSHVILGGVPNHGAMRAPLEKGNEFNGDGPFLRRLNQGSEVVAGVAFMTIRSDRYDKFAQPFSLRNPTAVGYAGPELKGALNVVLKDVDHRETAYSPQAFAEMYKFLFGNYPASTTIVSEARPLLSGLVTGYADGSPTNRGVPDVQVTVFEVDPASGLRRDPNPVHSAITDSSGSWGSFSAQPDVYYEFVVIAPSHWPRYFFRSPFLRSSPYVHLRLFEDKPQPDKGILHYSRPRGYVSNSRDKHSLDGKPVHGVKDGVPILSNFLIEFEGAERGVKAVLNDEALMVRTIPGAVVYIEFHQ
jgi:pimeloyl-ACP methyl ester carboxylesterase